MKKLLTSLAVIALLSGAWFAFGNPQALLFSPTEESEKAASTSRITAVETVAKNLDVPWGLAFLPDGNILVSERPGRLLELAGDGEIVYENNIPSATESGEGGLLGIALHPNFSDNHWLYIYETISVGDEIENRVIRYKYEDGEMSAMKVIIDGIAGARYHDGGRIAFGPDSNLYITTGDAGIEERAQNVDSLNGKILRLTDEGSIPGGNPFANAVYSYGHRNPQGLAWSSRGELYSSEHGPSGLESGEDEINRIIPEKNYGWPTVRGFLELGPAADAPVGNYANPLYASGPDITWAPASLAVVDARLIWAGLRGQAIYVAPIETGLSEDDQSQIRTYFKEEYGRLRTVKVGPNSEYLYFTTSNTNGRGSPNAGDDKLLRVSLEYFQPSARSF